MATQILIGVPNTTKEDIIKQTMGTELMVCEKKLLLTNNKYKLTKAKSKKCITYAVV